VPTLQDVFVASNEKLDMIIKAVLEQRLAGKIAQAILFLIIDAYIERMFVAVSMKFKLDLELKKPLMD
jgi:hypothetical protein